MLDHNLNNIRKFQDWDFIKLNIDSDKEKICLKWCNNVGQLMEFNLNE